MTSVKSESTVFPIELDTTSSDTTVYIRKNITSEVRTDKDGNETTMYLYDEEKYTKAEYESLLVAQNRADIDYLSIMMGVDL